VTGVHVCVTGVHVCVTGVHVCVTGVHVCVTGVRDKSKHFQNKIQMANCIFLSMLRNFKASRSLGKAAPGVQEENQPSVNLSFVPPFRAAILHSRHTVLSAFLCPTLCSYQINKTIITNY